MQPPSLKKNPTNEKYIRSEKWFYTDIVFILNKENRGRGKDGGGIGRENHFLPHKFLKRTFQRRANSTKQLL